MHREVALAALAAGKHVWVEKPVGRGVEDTAAVAEAARRAGVVTGVGFCYRFAPAVQHARALIEAGEIGDVNHYRGVFLADYANRAGRRRLVAVLARAGRLGRARRPDGPRRRHDALPRRADRPPQRPHRDDDPAAPAPARGARARTSAASQTDDLVDVENEDWAAALFEFGGGTVGSLEASRVIVGPRVQMRFEVHGTEGALSWELERMNELERFQLSDDGGDEGYTTILAGAQHPDFAAFQPGAGVPMGYDDLRVLEARNFLAAVRDGEQGEPGVEEMLACARVLDGDRALGRAAARWEAAR